MKLLLTGGLGFIGAHTVEHFLENTDWDIVVVDSLRFAGRIERLTDIEGYDPDRVSVVWHDLNVQFTPMTLERIGDVDYIINMASDSHVDRSITNPKPFIQNNVNLVLNMLEYARVVKPKKFIQIGTDEIFGPARHGESHVEASPLRPSNPYSASKAAQEQIAFAYWRTYDVPVILTRTMNNFGERQDIEKFVPMTIRKVVANETNLIHARKTGQGNWESGSRVWLHARNHADALLFILNKIDAHPYVDSMTSHPAWFNIAGEKELTNLEIVEMVGDILDIEPKYEFVDYHSQRPGHDLRYSLDGSLLRNWGWEPPMSVEESFEKTVNWSMAHPEWLGLA